MNLDEEKESPALLYRSLLQYSQVFLTEIPRRESRSVSINESINSNRDEPIRPSTASSDSNDTHHQLLSTRQKCQQRLAVCSRRKLSLLTFQEQVNLSHIDKGFICDFRMINNIKDFKSSSMIPIQNDPRVFENIKFN
jgi:hypothetical protein